MIREGGALSFTGTLVVLVDYNRTVGSLAIEAGLDQDFGNPDLGVFLSSGEGVVRREVEVFCLEAEGGIDIQSLLREFKVLGKRLIDSHTAFAVACQHPDEQRGHPLVTLFEDIEDDGFISLIFYEDDGERRLELDDDLVYHWVPPFCFLVVSR